MLPNSFPNGSKYHFDVFGHVGSKVCQLVIMKGLIFPRRENINYFNRYCIRILLWISFTVDSEACLSTVGKKCSVDSTVDTSATTLCTAVGYFESLMLIALVCND